MNRFGITVWTTLAFTFHIALVKGQTQPIFFFRDSLSLQEDSYFLYTLIGLRLEGHSAALIINPPGGWKLIGDPCFDFPKSTDTASVISLTFVRQPGASSNFERVVLQLRSDVVNNSLSTLDTFFYIRAPSIHSFSVIAPDPVIEMPERVKKVTLPVLVKNNGTTTGQYHLTFKTSLYQDALQERIRLRPGADTLIQYKLPISLVSSSGSRKVLVNVSDSTGIVQSVPITFNTIRGGGKIHATPFADFPIELETGLMMTDNQFSFYGATKGAFTLKNGSFDFSFRSKLYGPLNTFERHVFSVQLTQSRWHLTIGQLSTVQHFFSYGRGGNFVYRVTPNHQFGAQAIWHTVPGSFTNNTFSIWLQRTLNETANLFRVVSNLDAKKGLNEFLVYHETQWRHGDNLQLKVHTAIGWENFLRVPVSSSGNLALGGGYSLQQTGKKFELTSTWQRFPNFFPGVDKGVHNHLHQVRWLHKLGYVDLFYNYNSTVSSLLMDTLYLTNIFRFNIEKSGVRAGYRKNLLDLSLSTGWLRQMGVSAAQLPKYQFGELYFSVAVPAGQFVSLKSLLGYANNRFINRPVFISSTTFTYRYKSSGIRAFYLQQPVLKDSAVKVVLRINQTLSISPYVGFRLWKRVALNLRYSLTQTRFDDKINSSAGISASWQQPLRGWQVSFSGTFPLSRSAAPGFLGVSVPFFDFSIKKSLRIPIPFKKRYYRLVVTAFADHNSNKRFDSTDQPLEGLRVTIEKEHFITGKNGSFTWRNIDTGQYRVLLSAGSTFRGWQPPPANQLLIHVQSDHTVLLPFSKSCVVSGRVSVMLDAYSTLAMVPEDILVKAIDSTGREFSALTNKKGEYFINVPAGHYTVTLNPDAFKGSIRPVTLYQPIDLRTMPEGEVNFVLKEQKRPMRMLKQ